MSDNKKITDVPEYKDYPFIHLETLKYPYADRDGDLMVYVMRVMDVEYTINSSKLFSKKSSVESQLHSIIVLAKQLIINLKNNQRIKEQD